MFSRSVFIKLLALLRVPFSIRRKRDNKWLRACSAWTEGAKVVTVNGRVCRAPSNEVTHDAKGDGLVVARLVADLAHSFPPDYVSKELEAAQRDLERWIDDRT